MKTNEDTVNLIDEADYFLIDNPQFKVGDTRFIGLTATTFKEGNTTVERTYLEDDLKVKICDSLIAPIIDTAAEPTRTTIQEFLRNGRCDWAKIIYCPDSQASYGIIVSEAKG